MYYKNVLIEGNHVEGVHPHGIYVGESIGLTIRNNTVIKDPTTKVYKSGWEPVIDVADKSTGRHDHRQHRPRDPRGRMPAG